MLPWTVALTTLTYPNRGGLGAAPSSRWSGSSQPAGMLVLGARQQRVTARGGEAAGPLGSSLCLAAAGAAGGEEKCRSASTGSSGLPSWGKGLKVRLLLLLWGIRFSIVTMFVSPWMNEGLAGTLQLTLHSVTHPCFPDTLRTPESV